MMIKSWTIEAHGIEYGRVALWYEAQNDTLKWHRGYQYVDALGEPVKSAEVDFDIPHEMSGDMAWVDVPPDIQNALITIDEYTKQQIRQQEGLA